MNFIKRAYYKFVYQNGKLISRYVAHDLRKDILVVDNSKVESGILMIKDRIVDCLSPAKNESYQIPGFSEPKSVAAARFWKS